MEEFISTYEEETLKIADNFATRLKASDTVFLIGNLGAGKTTFVKGVAKKLGVKSRVISPTFVIAREYEANYGDIKTLYHLDLYRLTDSRQTEKTDIKDFINDKNGVTFIEWPTVAQDLINKKVWKILFEVDNDKRRIKISYE